LQLQLPLQNGGARNGTWSGEKEGTEGEKGVVWKGMRDGEKSKQTNRGKKEEVG